MSTPASGGLAMPPVVGRVTLALHVLLVLVSLTLTTSYFDNSLFSWHPVLMSLGYLLFMAESILNAVMFRHLAGEDRTRAIWTHALWQLPGHACTLGGFYAIYQNKVNRGSLHFMSTHGKVGLATLIISLLVPLGGALSFKKLGLLDLFPAAMRPMIKMAHRNAGLVAWLLSLLTIQLALGYPSMRKEHFTPMWQLGVAAMGALMLLLMLVAQPQSRKAASKSQ